MGRKGRRMRYSLSKSFFAQLSNLCAKVSWLETWGEGLRLGITLDNGINCTVASYDEIPAAVGRNRWELFVVWNEDCVDSVGRNLSEDSLIEWIQELSERE